MVLVVGVRNEEPTGLDKKGEVKKIVL